MVRLHVPSHALVHQPSFRRGTRIQAFEPRLRARIACGYGLNDRSPQEYRRLRCRSTCTGVPTREND
jgi:hypothetical protein